MKHEGKKTSLTRIILNVTRNIGMLIQLRRGGDKVPSSWPEIIKTLETRGTKLKVTKVMWEYPPEGWHKYNTDGASRGNPGISSYAFVLRDERGDVIYAEGAIIENTTNTVAEARAILEACKHCKQKQYKQVIIQTDSMLLWKVLEDKWTCPWSINDIVAEIKSHMQGIQHTLQHILREGNQLADHLASRAIDKGNCKYENFRSMEIEGRKIINSDKLKCPYLGVSALRG